MKTKTIQSRMKKTALFSKTTSGLSVKTFVKAGGLAINHSLVSVRA